MKACIMFMVVSVLFSLGCKKNQGNIEVSGNIQNGTINQPVSNANISFLGKVIQNGAYGSNDATLTTATSDVAGNYSCLWKRTSITDLKMRIAADGFITRTISLDQSTLQTDDENTINQTLYEEAIAQVHLVNGGNANTSDQVNFTFYHIPFEDCVCCAEGWQYFTGSSVDTTFACKAYGNSWLKYEVQINTLALDTVYRDSIWCPAHTTSPIEIMY
jgi:hypothetical protein